MFFINHDGETIGPYTTDEVRRRIAQGTIATDDFCWREGMADWQVIAETPPFLERKPAPAPRRLKPAPVTLPPRKRPVATSAAPDSQRERPFGAIALMLIGGILAVYCGAFYPSQAATDRGYARGLEVLLGQPLAVARLHDRIGGFILSAVLIIAGATLLLLSMRPSRD
ncbi:MAG TPA: DUF4339 domain-containing protein [Chthoniobacterales bacterium]